MGYGTQTLFRNKLTRNAVNAVSLILNTGQRSLQALYELLLAGSQ